jgi:hypothetical protein
MRGEAVDHSGQRPSGSIMQGIFHVCHLAGLRLRVWTMRLDYDRMACFNLLATLGQRLTRFAAFTTHPQEIR